MEDTIPGVDCQAFVDRALADNAEWEARNCEAVLGYTSQLFHDDAVLHLRTCLASDANGIASIDRRRAAELEKCRRFSVPPAGPGEDRVWSETWTAETRTATGVSTVKMDVFYRWSAKDGRTTFVGRGEYTTVEGELVPRGIDIAVDRAGSRYRGKLLHDPLTAAPSGRLTGPDGTFDFAIIGP